MPKEDDEDELQAPADWDGPVEDRRCTDILVLLMLWASWIAMTGVGIYAVTEGDYRKVVFPLDYDGNICGTDYGDIDMTDFPKLYYVNSYTGGVCVKDCPEVSKALQNKSLVSDVRTLITYGGLYQVEGSIVPANYISIGNYTNSDDVVYCSQESCYPNASDPSSSWTTDGVAESFGMAYYAGDTYEVLFRCYYTVDAENEILDLVNAAEEGGLIPDEDAMRVMNKFYADVWVARYYILGVGLGASLVFGLFYIFLMRIPFLLKSIVWSSILLTIILFMVGGYYMYTTAQDWDDEDPQTVDDDSINATRIAAYCLWVIGSILFILACCLRKQIAIAIGCVKTAGRAVNHMFAILLVPVIQAIGLMAFVIVWTYYAVYLASLAEITTEDYEFDDNTKIAVRSFEFDDFTYRCGWYLLFCLFWTSNYIVAIGDMAIALAVARYYFTREKWRVGSWTVFHATWQVLWYHSGTCAYGSLLIAIVQIIRAVIAKAQRAAKKADNRFAKAILCCCQCCFCLLEKCLRFISKNAYIQCAIFSSSFCKSCRKAFFLIARNLARVAALTYVSAAVLIIGKLFISSVVTLFGYFLIINSGVYQDLNSTAGPTILIFLIAYWVSDFFMDVFDMSITAVLHCFIADEEMFTDQIYAEDDLKKYIDENGAEKDNE